MISIKITQIENGPFSENAWIISDTDSRDAILIDPGDESKRIAGIIEDNRLNLQFILATHGHLDHIGAVCDLTNKFNVPFMIHMRDESMVKDLPKVQKMFGLPESEVPIISGYVSDQEKIIMGGVNINVIETPGHTQGGVCFLVEGHLFSGDTLFSGSIGRTDLPGGDYSVLISSIKQKLISLPDDTIVHSGHGPDTMIGIERQQNPFLQ
ncbi:MAG: MBL fold metallo-hydrolase [Candidatus Marinimicrobia bacterium]|nr:MBL fold metallo-hydrolase [Candidatus Neomarinimicrobiota bacterium]